jgi:hypothetical protein
LDDPTGTRHGGMPTFPWRMAPDGLATRRQLRADGLCPGGRPPVAQLLWHGVGGTRAAYLYDRAHARPKRVPSPAQLAALDKAIAARRTCPRCGTDAGYCLPRTVDACPTCDRIDTESESSPMAALDRDALLDAALSAAARGWHVFPLRPNDKRPAVSDWQTRATTDVERIRRCWSAGPYGVGIACGPSGLVVVDLDVPKEPDDLPPDQWREMGVLRGDDVLVMLAAHYAEPLPYETFVVRTASGGTHLYFTALAGAELRNTAGRIGWKIDTRAAGGYVVGAGSIVGGKPYRLIHGEPPAPLPGWLLRLLAPPARPATGTARIALPRNTRRYVAAALNNEVQRVLDAPHGQRNHTLYGAALSLGRFVASGELPRDLVENALQDAADTVGPDYRKNADTIRNGIEAALRAPRRGTAA